ncbi:recombinase family protein [Paenibacillus riograndensis]|uniref:Recombinase domain-containing protein n=1 Tax=Paenibacillus riograndensis SBR5 TaxID=1073571 RepID=A0A0E4H749_9BACL|nr:recombinase family protein [Paenibacillus riograndensis]CQR52435.1 hypothetical protein PRIO_0826 [Paenibacillus riograndensis SBR5]
MTLLLTHVLVDMDRISSGVTSKVKGLMPSPASCLKRGGSTPSMVAGKKKQSIYWNGSSVQQILENPDYSGDMVKGRETTISVTNKARRERTEADFIVVKETHEAIISRDVFDTVQQLIESNRRRSPENPDVSSRPHQNVNLFTGVIFCEDCGRGLHYQRNCKGYICGRSHKHGNKACKKHRVREKALSRYLEDVITKSDYDDYVVNRDAELVKLLQDKGQIEASMSAALDSRKLDEVKAVVTSALAFEEVNKEVINRFIEKIVVARDSTVKLYYCFAGISKILELLA